MKTFILIVACIGLLIDGGCTTSCNSGNVLWSNEIKLSQWNLADIGIKCWTGGVGPIRSCNNGLICYNGNNPAQDGYCLFQDGHCVPDPSSTCYSGNIWWRNEIQWNHWNLAGTKCWTAGVGPIGTIACCDGLTCFNGNSPAQNGYCLALWVLRTLLKRIKKLTSQVLSPKSIVQAQVSPYSQKVKKKLKGNILLF